MKNILNRLAIGIGVAAFSCIDAVENWRLQMVVSPVLVVLKEMNLRASTGVPRRFRFMNSIKAVSLIRTVALISISGFRIGSKRSHQFRRRSKYLTTGSQRKDLVSESLDLFWEFQLKCPVTQIQVGICWNVQGHCLQAIATIWGKIK